VIKNAKRMEDYVVVDVRDDDFAVACHTSLAHMSQTELLTSVMVSIRAGTFLAVLMSHQGLSNVRWTI